MIIVSTLALIGAVVVSIGLWLVISEMYRALRQSYRVGVVYLYEKKGDRKGPPLRFWWYLFKDELGADYASRTIGGLTIPWELNKPIHRRKW